MVKIWPINSDRYSIAFSAIACCVRDFKAHLIVNCPGVARSAIKMVEVSILIAFLTHCLWALGQKQLTQCTEYFTHVTKAGTTDMVGQIEIPPPSTNDMFYLKVALSITTELGQVVQLELARSIKESVRHVHQGRPLLYHVYYPMSEQIPSLSAIWFNSQRYCPDPEVSGNITANVELGHILSLPNKEPIVYSYGPWQEISQPWHRNLSIYRIHNPPYDRLNLNDSTPMTVSSSNENANECGITSYYTDDTNRLIPDGETTLPGQWPWLVAIYRQDSYNVNVYRFTCTGTILTPRHVVTNALCVRTWRFDLAEFRLIDSQRIYVYFGQLNSRVWHVNHTGIINHVTVDIKTSSEYLERLNNLAILILKTAVEYNAFIKPICLWSGSTNFQDTVNMTGYIVGWGADYIKSNSGFSWTSYTGDLRMEKVPLMNFSVDFSEYDLQYYMRTDYHCADPGGGLVVFNTTTGRYQLHAVMSFRDLHGKVQYVNVAKLTSWIRQQIYPT